MLKQKVFEIGKKGKSPTTFASHYLERIRGLPDVPVLSETLLSIELAAADPPVELSRISRLILSDLGATLQVLRLAGLQSAESSPPSRIEDCISGLGLKACLDAMSKQTITRTRRYAAILEAWNHARTIAEITNQLAEEMARSAPSGEASLVGLCHEIGRLPNLLRWDRVLPPALDVDRAGLILAESWSLPSCLRQYFAGCLKGQIYSPWPAIVDRAHQIAKNPVTLLCV